MIITVNGVEKYADDNAKISDLYGDNYVVIVSGYNVAHEYALKNGDKLTVIKKGEIPSERELKIMLSARHSPEVTEKIAAAKVAVAGLGGLGSNVAVMLSRLGVGELLLVDYDVVEPSNLNRQCYYISDLGKSKCEALSERIKDINPYITVKTQCLTLTRANAASVLRGYPIIVEALDGAEQKAMLINTVLEFTDSVIVSGSGMAGYDSANLIKTKRPLQRLYVCGDNESEADIGVGLMPPRVTVASGHQANQVLRLILGVEEI